MEDRVITFGKSGGRNQAVTQSHSFRTFGHTQIPSLPFCWPAGRPPSSRDAGRHLENGDGPITPIHNKNAGKKPSRPRASAVTVRRNWVLAGRAGGRGADREQPHGNPAPSGAALPGHSASVSSPARGHHPPFGLRTPRLGALGGACVLLLPSLSIPRASAPREGALAPQEGADLSGDIECPVWSDHVRLEAGGVALSG